MRKLDFTRASNEKAEEFFEIIYDSATGSPRGFPAPNDARVIGKVLDRLEAVGVHAKRGDMDTYTLNAEGGVVVLEEDQYKLLSEAIRAVRWSGMHSRRAVAAIDWFDAAPSVTDDNGVSK